MTVNKKQQAVECREPVKPGRCAARLQNINKSSRANEVKLGDLLDCFVGFAFSQ